MAGGSESVSVLRSNFRGGKFATQKIGLPDEGISFRDLARFAFKRKTSAILAALLGTDERTAKRWLSPNGSRAPDRAVTLVLGEIMRRYR